MLVVALFMRPEDKTIVKKACLASDPALFSRIMEADQSAHMIQAILKLSPMSEELSTASVYSSQIAHERDELSKLEKEQARLNACACISCSSAVVQLPLNLAWFGLSLSIGIALGVLACLLPVKPDNSNETKIDNTCCKDSRFFCRDTFGDNFRWLDSLFECFFYMGCLCPIEVSCRRSIRFVEPECNSETICACLCAPIATTAHFFQTRLDVDRRKILRLGKLAENTLQLKGLESAGAIRDWISPSMN